MKISSDHIVSFIISVVVLVLLVYGGWFMYNQSGNRVLVDSKDAPLYKNKFVIFFVYDGYTDKKDALLPIAVFKETLNLVAPFTSMQDSIVTKTFATGGAFCHPAQINGKDRLNCEQKVFDALKKLGALHYKTVIVSPISFSSFSDYGRQDNNALYISTYKGSLKDADFKRWMGIVFSQELGHSLGLSYEYFKSKPSQFGEDASSSLPNCAPDAKTAKKWWAGYKKKTYFKGCAGGDTFLYPEQNTLMSDLPQKQSYGVVSQDYLTGILSCFYVKKTSFTGSLGEKSCLDFKNTYHL